EAHAELEAGRVHPAAGRGDGRVPALEAVAHGEAARVADREDGGRVTEAPAHEVRVVDVQLVQRAARERGLPVEVRRPVRGRADALEARAADRAEHAGADLLVEPRPAGPEAH